MVAKINVLPNEKFNRLTFIRYGENKGKNRGDIFICECGKVIHTSVCDVRTGHTKSCGCFSVEITKKIVNKARMFWCFSYTRIHSLDKYDWSVF